MGAGASARGADEADDLLELYLVAQLDIDALEMRVARAEPGAVIDFDHVAVRPARAGIGDGSGRGRQHVVAVPGREIEARVKCPALREGSRRGPKPLERRVASRIGSTIGIALTASCRTDRRSSCDDTPRTS